MPMFAQTNDFANGQHSFGAPNTPMTTGYVTDAAPPSPFILMGTSIGEVGRVVMRLESVADALCGPVPQSEGKPVGRLAGAGIFGDLASAAGDLADFVGRAERALERIQRHLPGQ